MMPEPGGLDRLLDDLVRRVPGAEQVIVLSSDGLLVGRSRTLGRDDGEHLSAVASGLQVLARGASRHFGSGSVRQTVVEMDNRYLVVTSGDTGTCLAALAQVDVDLGLLVYEMNLLVQRVGADLGAQARRSEADAGVRWNG